MRVCALQVSVRGVLVAVGCCLAALAVLFGGVGGVVWRHWRHCSEALWSWS